LHNALPVSIVIALLLAIVVTSYQQTVRAYPSGGGAYTVAHENLGRNAGTVAASAIMVDYVLTVSVSVAAGVAAITSAAPDLHDLRVPIGVVMIGLMMLGNLRGVREAGTIFAIPTYVFIFSMGAVIAVGLVRVIAGDAPGSLLHGAPAREEVAATQGLTIFLLMRAFASGSTALTGVEAISNGVPSFKPPEVRNAQVTLAVMALVLGFLFLGVTFLTSRFGLAPTEHETIVSQLGREVLGKNALYYTYQVATALVLFLAANTGFAAFPMVASILARDRCVPRQFSFKGDRLAYSNGIVFLAAAASLLLIAFGGEVTKLIPLYAVGVFASFTLSQSGMVRRWLRLREGAWKVSLTINAVGAVATGVVTVIIATTKFTHGAWISILMMMLLMALFTLIRRHYDRVEEELEVEEGSLLADIPTAAPLARPPSREHVIVPVDAVNRISAAAVAFARELSASLTAVHVTDDREAAEKFRSRWQQTFPDVPLLLIESPYRAFVAPMLAYVESLERAEPDVRITVVLPSLVLRHWWERPLHNQDVLRLRPHLQKRPGVRVVDFPFRVGEDEGG
jgi:amino acid transporter